MKPKTKTEKPAAKKPAGKRASTTRASAGRASAVRRSGGEEPARTLKLHQTSHPVIYEVNARVLLQELSERAGSSVTLAGIPDEILDAWAAMGFDAVWLMGVWSTGPLGRDIARKHEGLQGEYRRVLPDLNPEDIAGSPYSVVSYTVPRSMGGEAGLRSFREKLASRGIALILDFVCNHTARDHPWVSSHPEYYIEGRPGEDVERPDIYFAVKTAEGEKVLAYGRDPTFPGWTDTAQLNYMEPKVRTAIIAELERIASLCDGVRCDMAMLLLRFVFILTWGDQLKQMGVSAIEAEFWKESIETIRAKYPRFIFLAEAYWNNEWHLQQLGFDYTYDKVLYDRLLHEGATAVRDHLKAEMDYQRKLVRFTENHDEPRAARAFGSEGWHFAASMVMACVPGMTLIHDGQIEGRTIKLPVQLRRRPAEEASERTRSFYQRLLGCLQSAATRRGEWHLMNLRPAWHDNATWQNFLVFCWDGKEEGRRMVVVNYAPHNGQCYVEIPAERLEGTMIEFRDLMSEATFVRDRSGLASKGMYFDLPGYGFHLFELKALHS